MFKRNKIVLSVIISLVLIAIAVPKIMLFISGNKLSCNVIKKDFFIVSPLDLNGLAIQLKKEGIIDNLNAFISVGEYKNLKPNKIALGKYCIEPGTSYRTLLNGFKINANGNGNNEKEVEVTFNNCITINDLAKKVSSCLFLDSAKLISYLNDKNTLKKYGFTPQQIPALFIPNTYHFFYDTDEKQFVERMAKEFKIFWTNERKEKIKQIGLNSPSEVVTLASIVYSEQSIVSEEWPIIAGLYLNRIKQGIRLQSDPTFKFCWGDILKGVQRLLNIHREINCEYNTYKINGLPPGPICLPPTTVVDAVLNKADVNFIYMCAKPDYSHQHNFAVSGAEHMKNARVFQNWLANELKKKNKR